MKKTKILVVTLIAGFALHRPALCQSNAADASIANSNLVYGTLLSNVIKLSTEPETGTNAVPGNAPASNAPATTPGVNESTSGAMTSNC